MPVENKQIPAQIPYDRIIERSLRTYFARHPSSTKIFACIGIPRYFENEILVLKDRLGWEVNTMTSSELTAVGCLLISIRKNDSTRIPHTLSEAAWPSLVVLYVETGKKKTLVFAEFEACGYRIYREWDEIAYLFHAASSEHILRSGYTLGDAEIRTGLEKSWRRIRRLPGETQVEYISIDARELLVPERFDIAIKSHYARLWLNQTGKTWREYAYFEQALRITGPGLDLYEYDGMGKQGLARFLNEFHCLLADLDPARVPLVPVDFTHAAFDGVHRISAAIAMGRPVNCVKIDSATNSRATAAFFHGNSHGHSPLPNDILEESAIEYCRIKDTTAIALIFPVVASEEKAIHELAEVSDVVYRKDIILSPKGGEALLRQVYQGHQWFAQNGMGEGFLNKQRYCFPFTGVLRVLLLDRINPNTLRPAKERIRSIYDLGNHSIHITDSSEETLRVARVVFNRNSVALLDMGIGKLPNFHEKLFLYRNWLEASDIDEEEVCIDGSAILALLGLRECRDLDFLYHGDPKCLPPTPEKIDCHNTLV